MSRQNAISTRTITSCGCTTFLGWVAYFSVFFPVQGLLSQQSFRKSHNIDVNVYSGRNFQDVMWNVQEQSLLSCSCIRFLGWWHKCHEMWVPQRAWMLLDAIWGKRFQTGYSLLTEQWIKHVEDWGCYEQFGVNILYIVMSIPYIWFLVHKDAEA